MNKIKFDCECFNNVICSDLKVLQKGNKIIIKSVSNNYSKCVDELKSILRKNNVKNVSGFIVMECFDCIYKIYILNGIVCCDKCYIMYDYEKNYMDVIKI